MTTYIDPPKVLLELFSSRCLYVMPDEAMESVIGNPWTTPDVARFVCSLLKGHEGPHFALGDMSTRKSYSGHTRIVIWPLKIEELTKDRLNGLLSGELYERLCRSAQ